MASEQTSSASGSLADRISKPVSSNGTNNAVGNPATNHSMPTGSWADEVGSPVANTEPPTGMDTEVKAEDTSLSEAQTDGAGEIAGGSNLMEPEYDVEVKLSDIQADPNNPLFSIKSFEELGLLVTPPQLY